MVVILKIVSVGNSKGIRIPGDILRRQGMCKDVDDLVGLIAAGEQSVHGANARRPEWAEYRINFGC
jgi:hypothetical protein